MPTQKAHLQIEQGSDFTAQIEIQSYLGIDYDLSTATITSEMRKSWVSTIAYPFVCEAVSGQVGAFIMHMPWEQTSEIASGRYLYDVYIYDNNSGSRIRVIEGTVFVSPGITRVSN